MRRMGFDFGLETSFNTNNNTANIFPKTCLRQFRWLFFIQNVSARGISALPPSQAARPNLSFTEMETRHLNENYYYPARPDWRPINVVLYDVVKNNSDGSRIHPVFQWLSQAYEVDEKNANWYPSTEKGFIRDCDLEMLDGCGNTIESWIFEQVWPQSVDFGTLNMANSEIVTCSLTLRYARAYVKKN